MAKISLRAYNREIETLIDRGQIEPFLVQRGFSNVHNSTLEDLKRIYFIGPNAGRVIPEGINIVSARVATAGS